VWRPRCDGAVLDINLRCETSEPIARELKARGTPILAVTGYSTEQRPLVFQDIPTLTKPVHEAGLVARLLHCLAE